MNVSKVLGSILLVAAVIIGGIQAARFMVNPFASEKNADAALVPVEKTNGKIKANFLVIGLDGDHTRSDVIMIIQFDEEKNKLTMMSVPRDTRVSYSGRSGLINAAYGTPVKQTDGTTSPGGIPLLVDKLTALTGIPINYYVTFTFEDFREVIDELGGVEFDVPMDMKYTDPYQDLYIDLKAGTQKLDGKAAEQLVRFRQYPMADLQRVQVQQDLFRAIVAQHLKAKTIRKVPSVYSTVKDTLSTNLTVSNMTSLGKKMLKIDWETDVETFTLPTKSDGGSHLVPDTSAIKSLMEEKFGYTPE